MNKREIDNVVAGGISLEIIKLLDGLSIGQAKWVLREAETMLGRVSRVAITSPDFSEQVQEFEAACRG